MTPSALGHRRAHSLKNACKVFYEPAALLRCEEGSTILLRLCSALEAFDLAIDADQSGLDRQPYWPIIEAELEADRQAEASAAAAAASAASARADAVGNGSSARGSSSHVQGWDQVPSSRDGEESWFRQQQRRQQQEQPESGRGGGWAASALSEFDQVAIFCVHLERCLRRLSSPSIRECSYSCRLSICLYLILAVRFRPSLLCKSLVRFEMRNLHVLVDTGSAITFYFSSSIRSCEYIRSVVGRNLLSIAPCHQYHA